MGGDPLIIQSSLGALIIAILDTLLITNDYNLHVLDQVCLSKFIDNTLTSPSKIESHGMATTKFNSLLIISLIVIVFSPTKVFMSWSPTHQEIFLGCYDLVISLTHAPE